MVVVVMVVGARGGEARIVGVKRRRRRAAKMVRKSGRDPAEGLLGYIFMLTRLRSFSRWELCDLLCLLRGMPCCSTMFGPSSDDVFSFQVPSCVWIVETEKPIQAQSHRTAYVIEVQKAMETGPVAYA